eukprot:SAG22_NODE_174_length_16466_cov_34.991568_17_plen_433_part_00
MLACHTTAYRRRPIARVPDPNGTAVPATIIEVKVLVVADFEWSDKLHGTTEPWVFFAQDDKNTLLHYEQVVFSKSGSRQGFSFHVTLPPPPAPPAYFVYGYSDQWLGSQAVCELDWSSTRLPAVQRPHTKLIGLEPGSTLQVRKRWPQVQVAAFDNFNPMQSQLVNAAYDSDDSLLIAAASGNGKTTVAELAILRHFSTTKDKKTSASSRPSCVLLLTMHPATAAATAADWRRRMKRGLVGGGSGETRIVELGPDLERNAAALATGGGAHIVCSSADHWEATTRRTASSGKQLATTTTVGLLILQNLHLIGTAGDSGAIMEVAISRLRLAQQQQQQQGGGRVMRVVGLSESVANADALAQWLGVKPSGVHSFKNGLRPRRLELVLKGFADRSVTARLQAMAKPLDRFLQAAEEVGEAVLVFVQVRMAAMPVQ